MSRITLDKWTVIMSEKRVERLDWIVSIDFEDMKVVLIEELCKL